MNSTTAYIIVCMLLLSALISLIVLLITVSEQPDLLISEDPPRTYLEYSKYKELTPEIDAIGGGVNSEAENWKNVVENLTTVTKKNTAASESTIAVVSTTTMLATMSSANFKLAENATVISENNSQQKVTTDNVNLSYSTTNSWNLFSANGLAPADIAAMTADSPKTTAESTLKRLETTPFEFGSADSSPVADFPDTSFVTPTTTTTRMIRTTNAQQNEELIRSFQQSFGDFTRRNAEPNSLPEIVVASGQQILQQRDDLASKSNFSQTLQHAPNLKPIQAENSGQISGWPPTGNEFNLGAENIRPIAADNSHFVISNQPHFQSAQNVLPLPLDDLAKNLFDLKNGEIQHPKNILFADPAMAIELINSTIMENASPFEFDSAIREQEPVVIKVNKSPAESAPANEHFLTPSISEERARAELAFEEELRRRNDANAGVKLSDEFTPSRRREFVVARRGQTQIDSITKPPRPQLSTAVIREAEKFAFAGVQELPNGFFGREKRIEQILLKEIFNGRESQRNESGGSAFVAGKYLSILLDRDGTIALPKNNGEITRVSWNEVNRSLETIDSIRSQLRRIHRLKLIGSNPNNDSAAFDNDERPTFVAVDGDHLKRVVLLNKRGEILTNDAEIPSNVGAKDLCVDGDSIFVLSRQALNGSSDIFVYDTRLRYQRRLALRAPAGENCNFIEARNEFLFVSCQSAVLKISADTKDELPIVLTRFGIPEGSYALAIQPLRASGRLLAAQRGRAELHLFDQAANLKSRLVNVSENPPSAIYTSLAIMTAASYVSDVSVTRRSATTIFALEYITNKIHVFVADVDLQ